MTPFHPSAWQNEKGIYFSCQIVHGFLEKNRSKWIKKFIDLSLHTIIFLNACKKFSEAEICPEKTGMPKNSRKCSRMRIVVRKKFLEAKNWLEKNVEYRETLGKIQVCREKFLKAGKKLESKTAGKNWGFGKRVEKFYDDKEKFLKAGKNSENCSKNI